MAICLQRLLGWQVEPCDAAKFRQVTKDFKIVTQTKQVHEIMKQAMACKQSGDEAGYKKLKGQASVLKSNLPALVFSCSDFEPHDYTDSKGRHWGVGKWRHKEYGILNGLFMLDVDELREPRKTWEEIQQREEFRYWKDRLLLVFVTPSGYGLKIVAQCRLEDGNLASHQNKMAKDFGVESDKSTKDCSRLSYAPIEENILYLNDLLFNYTNPEWCAKYQPEYRAGVSQPDLFGDNEKGADYSDYRYHGIAIPEIISAWLEGEDPKVGDRHSTLLNLASELKYVCERNDEIARYFLNREEWVQDLRKEGDRVDQTISDGLAYKMNKWMPKRMYKAVKSLEHQSEEKSDRNIRGERESLEYAFAEYGDKLRALSEDFPAMKSVFHEMSDSQLPAALFVAAACYGTLLTRTWYHFYFQPEVERRLNYEVFIVDDPTSGKSFASEMYKTILSPIIAKDKAGNSQINEYKKNAKMQSSKSEKKKGDGLIMPTPIIRIHGPRTSNQTFIEDMYYAVEEVDGKPIHLHMFTFDSELENNARLNSGSAGWQDKSVLELKAFHNEEDSQQYKNMDSISGPFDVFWNFVYTGTPVALGKKVNNNNFGSGLSTRLAVLPLCSDTFKPLPFRKQSKVNIQVIDDLKAWAFKFDEVSGELPVWPLVEHTYHWIVEMLANAKQNDDKVSALLSKRVPYYGINVSVPFILMRHWDEWKEAKTFVIDEKDKELCSIVMEIQYASQVFFFGTMAKTYLFNKDMDVNSTERYFSKAKKLFDIMPSEFNRQKLMEIGQLTEGAARIQLHRWIKENLISGKGAGKKAIYNKIH